jgi:hypothetical protein
MSKTRTRLPGESHGKDCLDPKNSVTAPVPLVGIAVENLHMSWAQVIGHNFRIDKLVDLSIIAVQC